MKILMIGNKESGKTTYMASAFGVMILQNTGFKGFIRKYAMADILMQRIREEAINFSYIIIKKKYLILNGLTIMVVLLLN